MTSPAINPRRVVGDGDVMREYDVLREIESRVLWLSTAVTTMRTGCARIRPG